MKNNMTMRSATYGKAWKTTFSVFQDVTTLHGLSVYIVNIMTLRPSDLEWFDEGPQQIPNPLETVQQFHQTHDTEESEQRDGHAHVLRVLKNKTFRKRHVLLDQTQWIWTYSYGLHGVHFLKREKTHLLCCCWMVMMDQLSITFQCKIMFVDIYRTSSETVQSTLSRKSCLKIERKYKSHAPPRTTFGRVRDFNLTIMWNKGGMWIHCWFITDTKALFTGNVHQSHLVWRQQCCRPRLRNQRRSRGHRSNPIRGKKQHSFLIY